VGKRNPNLVGRFCNSTIIDSPVIYYEEGVVVQLGSLDDKARKIAIKYDTRTTATNITYSSSSEEQQQTRTTSATRNHGTRHISLAKTRESQTEFSIVSLSHTKMPLSSLNGPTGIETQRINERVMMTMGGSVAAAPPHEMHRQQQRARRPEDAALHITVRHIYNQSQRNERRLPRRTERHAAVFCFSFIANVSLSRIVPSLLPMIISCRFQIPYSMRRV
jgi:hypothetical protein